MVEATINESASGDRGNKKNRLLVAALLIIFIIIGCILSVVYLLHKNSSPVPKNIRQNVSFPIYYTDQKKLPSGFTLNPNSFKNPQKDGVLFTVIYDGGKKLVFTEQTKPSNDELGYFNSKYIPIHRQILTSVGTATIGAINQETVVSLPTDNNWIIMTGPSKIDQASLDTVLKSLTKS